MYTIHADGKLLFNSLSEDVESIALSPKLELDINKAGSASFVLPPGNEMHGNMEKLKTIITVEQDGEQLFRGRVMESEGDLYNQQSVYCEGDRAFLLDSMQTPYYYSGSVHGLFQQLINNHNAMVDAEKQFVIGEVTAVLDSETTEVECENHSSTYSEIEQRLLNAYGGYLRTRTVDNTHYIDWVKTYGVLNTQPIEFSINMLDLTDKIDAGDVFTCLIPIGASVIDEDGEYTDPVSIASVNNGLNYIQDDEAVARYGKIWRTHTWSYIEEPAKLLEKAREYLKTGIALETITVKAIDMHFTDGNVKPIRIGDRVYIISNPHGISKLMTCSQIEIDLVNPENTVYTFGEKPRTLTENVVKAEEEVDSLTGGRGGGGRGIKDELTDIIRWAEYEFNQQEGEINFWAGETDKANTYLNEAIVRIDGAESQIELLTGRADNVENRATAVELLLNGADGTAGLVASVTEHGERISAAELRIDGVNSKIDMVTGGIDISELSERVTAAELEIDGMNAKIDLLTDATDITDLAKRVSSAEVAIDGLNADILLKASIETTDLLTEEVETLSAQLRVQAEEISGKVSNTDFQSALSLKADQSSLTTLSNSVDNRFNEQGDLIAGNGTQIKANSDAIALRAVKADVDAEFEVQAGQIAAKVSQTDFNKLGNRVTTAEIDIDAANARIDQKADLTITTDLAKRVNQAEVDINAAEAAIALKADSSLVDQYGKRLTAAEVNIDGLAAEIELKASKTAVDELGNALTKTDAQLKVQSDQIATKVSQTDFNNLGKRVSTAESTITQHANQIATKVSQTDFNKLGTRVTTAESSITQQANQITAISKTLDSQGNRLNSAELLLNGSTGEAGLVSRVEDAESSIIAQGKQISAKADLILLEGYVKANELEAEIATINKFFSGETYASSMGISGNLYAQNVNFPGNVSLLGRVTNVVTVSMGDVASHTMFGAGVGSSLDLSHSHKVIVNDNGTVTLGEVSSSGGSFKIADTKAYKDGVSAAYTQGKTDWTPVEIKRTSYDATGKTVTVQALNAIGVPVLSLETIDASEIYAKGQTDWQPDAITRTSYNTTTKTVTVRAENAAGVPVLGNQVIDASEIYNAGYFAGEESGGSYDEGYVQGKTDWMPAAITRTEYSTTNKTVTVRAENAIGVPVLGGQVIDASEIYNAGIAGGASTVTLSQGGWLRAQNVITASNGATETVNLPPMSFEESDWMGADPYKMIRVTITEADGSKNLIRSHIVYSSGLADTVTLSQSGWTGSLNTVSASNGKQISVTLPAFTTSVDAWNSLHKTYARFYSTNADGSSQFQKYAEVDATSVYNAGKEENLPTSITRTGYNATSKTVTVKAANSYKDLLTGVTIDAREIYNKGQIDWQPNSIERASYSTTGKTVTVRAMNAAGVPVLGGQVIDATEIYNAGFSAGEGSGSGYDDGYAKGKEDWNPTELVRSDYSTSAKTVTVRATNAAGVPVISGTIDASEIYTKGQTDWQPTSIERTNYSTGSKTVTVRASNAAGVPVISGDIDASEIWQDGYDAGADTNGGYDDGYAKGKTDWEPVDIERSGYDTTAKTVTVRALNAAGVPVLGLEVISASEIFDAGYSSGYADAGSGSYDEGYEAGRAAGYSAGYAQGQADWTPVSIERTGYDTSSKTVTVRAVNAAGVPVLGLEVISASEISSYGYSIGFSDGWSDAEDSVTVDYDFDGQRLSSYRVQITGSVWASLAGKTVASSSINTTLSV